MRKGCHKCEITKILFAVSRAVSSSLDLDEVNTLVLKESMQALSVDHAALFLFDERSGHLILTKAEGFSQDQMGNLKLLGGWEVINEQVLKNRKPLMVNDLKKNPIFKEAHLSAFNEELPVKSFLAVPLLKDDGILGTLIVSNKARPGYSFTKEDEELLVILSNQIAIAIANAKLFEELSRTQAEFTQQEKLAVIGTLSAGINHEIKNPLTIIRGTCELFIQYKTGNETDSVKAGELLAEAKGIMQKVIEQADRAFVITTRLANFAKPSSGQAERVNIDKEIDEVIGLVNYELRMAEIDIEKNTAKDLPDVLANKKQFQEVFFNLIRNAAQAIDKKGKITITGYTGDGRVTIDIQDTGSGIPADKVGKLFSAFFTTKAPGKGTGLGLYIVRKIVEKNGGTIRLKETQPGKGTTFTVEFPMAT